MSRQQDLLASGVDLRTRALAKRCAEVAFEQHRLGGQRTIVLRSAVAALMLDPAQPSRRGLVSIATRQVIGSRIVDLLRAAVTRGNGRRPDAISVAQEARSRISEAPTDPGCHQELGLYFLGQGDLIRAYACLRTASALSRLQGLPESQTQSVLRSVADRLNLPEASTLDQVPGLLARGDPYGRFRFLAQHVALEAPEQPFTLLDVGGGNGFLAMLLPRADYILVDPLFNGLSAQELPFEGQTFDAVVCSHVLEHVESHKRKQFVGELVRMSRRQVLILGPFAPPKGRPLTEEAIWASTRTPWASEHLDYGLPILDDLRDWLEELSVRYDIIPHADARVMYWQFLATHFAALAGESEAVEIATEFYQRHFDYRPADPSQPHDFLVRACLTENGVSTACAALSAS